jgi:hypothetical protein
MTSRSFLIVAMQTLGLSDSTPRSESRLKSLFWPSVESNTDVDHLGTQGFWLCALVAIISLVIMVVTGHMITGFFVFLFFYLGGIGVRERSFYAAIVVFMVYVLDFFSSGPSVPRILFSALLLSNIRATWLSKQWNQGSAEAELPPRLAETIGDKLADQFPRWFWPKIRIVYYIYSVLFLLLLALGFAVTLAQRIQGLRR